jgi:two-component system cell cycle sensor histidine kinase/response regulator CckA
MDKGLRILILEDVPTDAEMMERELRKEGIKFSSKQVDTREDFQKELKEFAPDIILSDYKLPNFDGMAALEITKELTPTIPFIIVTGSMNEETAVECMKAGAVDYVIKDHLGRIGPAVKGALENKKIKEEKTRLEEVLWKSAREWRAIFAAVNNPLVFMDLERRIRRCNKAMANLLGKDFQEIIGHNCCEILHGVSGPIEGCPVARLRETRRRETLVLSMNDRWFNIVADPLLDENGSLIGAVHAMSDITEVKQAEEALRESEKRYRQVIENATEIIYSLEIDGNFVYGNPACLKATGFSLEELRQHNYQDLIVPEHQKRLTEIYIKQFLERQAKTYEEFPFFNKSGEVVWFAQNASLVIEDGKVVGFHIIARDITERKRVEEALKESEERYRTAIEHSNDGVTIVKGDIHLYVNQKFLEIFGYSHPEEIVGRPLLVTVHSDDRDRVIEINRKRQRGEDVPSGYEFKGIRKDGGIVYIEVSATKTIYRGEAVSLAYLRDITERKRVEEERAVLQEQFRQSQKMEAIGRLAGGIAHDFNNLLTIIKGNSQLSLMDLKQDDPGRENLEEIQKAADKASDLVRQLLAFSRRQMMEIKVVDLNTLLRNLEKMLGRVIGEDIELVTILAENLRSIKVDPGQVEQVIMNLAVNAKDAMPSGGKLTIETANVELDEEYVHKHIAAKPGHYVMLSVSDAGVGMSPEIKERVFEPFFTTKEKGKGTGLGLSTIYGIVKQSGGNIWVYSEPGQGTTFKIYLPQVDEPVDELKEEVVKDIARGNETILVVEDEETVRKLAIRILKKQGYRVVEASEGGNALLLGEEFKDPIHLILTDIVMPKMSGCQLVERLKEIHPEMKVLYMSGYTDNAVLHHGVLEKGTNFIQKPFTVDGLTRKVRKVLDK